MNRRLYGPPIGAHGQLAVYLWVGNFKICLKGDLHRSSAWKKGDSIVRMKKRRPYKGQSALRTVFLLDGLLGEWQACRGFCCYFFD